MTDFTANSNDSGRGLDELDESLVERARDGGEALDELLKRIRPFIRRWALISLGDPDCAADVTQRVLLYVNRSLNEFQGDGRFTSWLYRITARAVIDEHRREKRSVRLRDAMLRYGATEAGGRPSPNDPESLDAMTVRRLVTGFAEELPNRQREVFDLVDLQGFDPAEVARMMDIAPATARVHLLRARRKIRAILMKTSPEIYEEYG